MMRRMLMIVGTALLIAVPQARASDQTGIYALIEKVEIEPAEGQAERIRVHGVFALPKSTSTDEYGPPVRGFLYFSLPKEKQDNARKEWADLKKLAGSGDAIAFGSRRSLPMLKVRSDSDTTKDAVAYPLDVGLTKLNKNHPQAKALHAVKPKP